MFKYKTYFEEKAEKAVNKKVIRNCLKENMPVSKISKLVGVPTATVNKLKKNR